MKAKISTFLIVILASIGTMFASGTQVDDIWYNFDDQSLTASVTYASLSYNVYEGDVVIPSSVTFNAKTYNVTSIGDSAFWQCRSLTSVTLPNSVINIGHAAFYNCSTLVSVALSNNLVIIGGYAFGACYNLPSIEIPNSVTTIGGSAFTNCRSLTSVTIPNSVTSIGGYAFSYCSGLTSVTIGNSVTSLENAVFCECSNLMSVIIGNGVTNIGSGTFYHCYHLTSIEIPNSVTTIGSMAFSTCNRLTSVTIPNSVTKIGAEAFEKCSNLTSIVIPNSVTSIGDRAFYKCTGLTSVTIGNSVTSIGIGAFYDCTALISVNIPNSVTSIGNEAFEGCYSLPVIDNIRYADTYLVEVEISHGELFFDTIIIKEGTRWIGNYAFSRCASLTSFEIPNSVIGISANAFYGCALTSITIPENIISLGNNAFGNNPLTSVILNSNSIVSRNYTSSYSLKDIFGSQIAKYIIGNSVTSIGESLFYNCSAMTSVSIPNSVTNIGNDAFGNCSNLTDIYVICGDLDRVKQMINNDSRVKYEPLPYTITTTATNGTVVKPQNICEAIELTATSDYGYHFTQWSDGVTDNPRSFVLTQDTTFTAEFAIDKSGTCGKDNALVWEYDDQSKILTITGNGELTENYTFGVEAPTQMNTLIIGDGVTAIGDSAFYNIRTLIHLFIGGNVEYIGDYAFAECRNVDDITSYSILVPTINATTFANIGNKQYIYLYVPVNRERSYKRDEFWGEFDIQIKEAETTTTDGEVVVVPTDNTAEISWPTVDAADTYEIEITKDGVVVCVLKFNSSGQLVGIAFAPGRNGANYTQQTQTTGFKFTVTGLASGTNYGYTIFAKDTNDQSIDTKSGSFTTTSVATSIDQINSFSPQGGYKGRLILRDGQILIHAGEKTYTVTGQEVR